MSEACEVCGHVNGQQTTGPRSEWRVRYEALAARLSFVRALVEAVQDAERTSDWSRTEEGWATMNVAPSKWETVVVAAHALKAAWPEVGA